MFTPKYSIRLDTKAFPLERVICLGQQLKSIVKNVCKQMESHAWLCTDVDAISPVPQELEINSFQLKEIGDDSSLINLCENIDQFLSGVFIAVRDISQNPQYSSLRVGTEDDPFRPLNLEGVLIEIRAFDTSCFEVYSEDRELIKLLSKTYNTECHC